MMLRLYFYIVLISLFLAPSLYAGVSRMYIGKQIPKSVDVFSNFIITDSDSLFLNGKLLDAGTDYLFFSQLQRFDILLPEISDSDTLIVKYTPAPTWVKQRYGKSLPDIMAQNKSIRLPVETQNQTAKADNVGDIEISGSKSFRISSATSQNSSLKQSLDLQISGELSKGLTIKGSISDRGYDPVYGTANSSINELDKVQIELQSAKFKMQLGDIVSRPSVLTGESYTKKISGIKTEYNDRNYSINVLAARPKGTFTTISFTGRDNLQGPYQITQTDRNAPIVPGSESVFLDGNLLSSGSENDYIIDYPLGQITFTSQVPIDSRSRISVDFEPFETEYKKEYYATEGNIYLNDSTWNIQFGWSREGDSKSEKLLSPFSEEDVKLLEQLGDTSDEFYSSSVVSDTLGSYILLTDSLPDSVFQYVGGDSGLYSIDFSFVGAGNGEYIFEGLDVYTYTGIGQGDYLPVKTLTTPKRQEYLTTSIRYGSNKTGMMKLGVSQSIIDRNLFSDGSSKGELIVAELFKPYRHSNSFNANFQMIDKNYRNSNRLKKSDFYFDMLTPYNDRLNRDEKILTSVLQHSLSSSIVFHNDFRYLKQGSDFTSSYESFRVVLQPTKKLTSSAGYSFVNAALDSVTVKNGTSDIFSTSLSYKLTPQMSYDLSYENSRRKKDYYQEENIVKSNLFKSSIGTQQHQVNYEYYTEDSSEVTFERKTKRNRINVSSKNTFTNFSYKSNFGYQTVRIDTQATNSFLARVKLDYNERSKKIHTRTTYQLSRESKQGRGLRYIKVNQGEGNYILEDSIYLYQENGDYILLEELLSGISDVKHGEKLFSFSKEWKKVKILFDSRIIEDLFTDQKRSIDWIVPFYSDEDKSYLLYDRKYIATLLMFPMASGYFINLKAVSNYQSRNIIAIDRVKEHDELELQLRQVYNKLYFDEKIKIFKEKTDSYYSISGDVDGYELSSKVSILVSQNRYGFELKYRDADLLNEGSAQILAAQLSSSAVLFSGSEIRSSVEYYSTRSENDDLLNSYLLTGNKIGKSGVLWSLVIQNRIKKSFRLNVRVNGREIKDRESRISVRTEFVAGF